MIISFSTMRSQEKRSELGGENSSKWKTLAGFTSSVNRRPLSGSTVTK
jgi:hypothetical protein